jgi:hypothetical protein
MHLMLERAGGIWEVEMRANDIYAGLSRLFFLLSLLGNITYGAGILLHSTEREYVMDNLPWLMGSLGTMTEDIIVSSH